MSDPLPQSSNTTTPVQAAKHDGHDHGAGAKAPMLKWALALTSLYLVAEVIGGLYFNSLALLSDAAHMLTDVAALVIALIAIGLSQKTPDARRTFGYQRFEILAAAFNAVLLFGVAIYVFIAAFHRFRVPEAIQTNGMLVLAAVGLIVNLISMRLLTSGKDASLNVKGAYLEVWADMVGSIGVIAGALIIRFTAWAWLDPIIAIGIGLWVLPRTWVLLRDTTNVLLEGVPNGLDLATIRATIKSVPNVIAVHDLHVWSTNNQDIFCTAHITHDTANDSDVTRRAVADVLSRNFEIAHVTIQVEDPEEDCTKQVSKHP